MSTIFKTCRSCGEDKLLCEFERRPQNRDGLRTECRDCRRPRRAKWAHTTYERERENPARQAQRRAAALIWRRTHLDENREAVIRWKARNPEKVHAHSIVYVAKKNGQLQPPSACPSCGIVGRVEAHHSDYDRPLAVTWLCRLCHAGMHVALRAEAVPPQRPSPN